MLQEVFEQQKKHNHPKWLVAYTRSRFEKEVARELDYKGIANYLPLRKTMKQRSDRKQLVEEPMFKSYVFVCTTPRNYYEAVTTTGIIKFVKFDGKPAVISERDIDVLRKITSTCSNVRVMPKVLAIGDRVLIIKGSLKGITGTVVELRGKFHVAIAIDSLHVALVVAMEASSVEKI